MSTMEKCPCETCIVFPMCKARVKLADRFETAVNIMMREKCDRLSEFIEYDSISGSAAKLNPVDITRRLFGLSSLDTYQRSVSKWQKK